jgi:hypothetical protein
MESKPSQYENWISNRSTDKNIKIKIKTPHILSQSTGQRIITKMNDCISMEVVQSHNKWLFVIYWLLARKIEFEDHYM